MKDLEVNYKKYLMENMTEDQAEKVMERITLDDIMAPHANELIIWEHDELGIVVDLTDKLDNVVTSINVNEL